MVCNNSFSSVCASADQDVYEIALMPDSDDDDDVDEVYDERSVHNKSDVGR